MSKTQRINPPPSTCSQCMSPRFPGRSTCGAAECVEAEIRAPGAQPSPSVLDEAWRRFKEKRYLPNQGTGYDALYAEGKLPLGDDGKDFFVAGWEAAQQMGHPPPEEPPTCEVCGATLNIAGKCSRKPKFCARAERERTANVQAQTTPLHTGHGEWLDPKRSDLERAHAWCLRLRLGQSDSDDESLAALLALVRDEGRRMADGTYADAAAIVTRMREEWADDDYVGQALLDKVLKRLHSPHLPVQEKK